MNCGNPSDSWPYLRACRMRPDSLVAELMNGPTWCVREGSHLDKINNRIGGPRVRVNGRWLPQRWAFSVTWGRIPYKRRKARPSERLETLRLRIGDRLGRYADIPF